MSKSSKKKPVKPNGFFVFMKELQEEFSRSQGRFIPMRNMPSVANPRWAQLSEAEKAEYQAKAKGIHPNSPSYPPRTRLDCRGDPVVEQRDPAAELADKRRAQSLAIKQLLKPGMEVTQQHFYFIHLQSLCEMTIKNNQVYLPCEVALVEFSLAAGIIRTFHTFIDPGKIPLGFRFLAQDTSEKTHQIPVSDFPLAEKDYRKVLGDIENFLDPKQTDKMPPLFCRRENVNRCGWSLGWLANNAGVRHQLDKLYEMESLFCELSGHLTGRPIGLFQAEELLRTSIYDYTAGTKCDYHEEREVPYCSLAAVNICAYVASESLCPEFKITLGAAHMPPIHATAARNTTFSYGQRSDAYAEDPYDDRVYADDSDDDSEEDFPALQPLAALSLGPRAPNGGTSQPTTTRPRGRGRGLLNLVSESPGGLQKQ